MRDIFKELSLFSDYLNKCKRDVKISASDSRIASTITWLIKTQEGNGSWDHCSVASTAVCIIAFESLRIPVSGWKLGDRMDEAINKAIGFLSSSYEHNQWEQDVWDTAVAVRALIRAKVLDSHKVAERPLQWLRTIKLPGYLSPHHIAQLVLAFSEAGAERTIIEEAIDQLEVMTKNSKLKYSPYVLAQVAEALCLRSEKSDILNDITSALEDSLKDTALDNASFLNICLALQGIHTVSPHRGLRAFRLSASSLFGPFCFRENGSWYQSPWYTSWALLTLTRYSTEVVIVAPYSEVCYEYDLHVRNALVELSAVRKKETIFLISSVVGATIWGALLSFFITYTSLQTNMYEWIKWAIGSILSASLVVYGPILLARIRNQLKSRSL